MEKSRGNVRLQQDRQLAASSREGLSLSKFVFDLAKQSMIGRPQNKVSGMDVQQAGTWSRIPRQVVADALVFLRIKKVDLPLLAYQLRYCVCYTTHAEDFKVVPNIATICRQREMSTLVNSK